MFRGFAGGYIEGVEANQTNSCDFRLGALAAVFCN